MEKGELQVVDKVQYTVLSLVFAQKKRKTARVEEEWERCCPETQGIVVSSRGEVKAEGGMLHSAPRPVPHHRDCKALRRSEMSSSVISWGRAG